MAYKQHCQHKVKTPTLLQMEITECGAASLGIILGYYNYHTSLDELRTACGVSRDGSKVNKIVQAATAYGLDAKAFALPNIFSLKATQLPCIIFWKFNHFLVLEGFQDDKAYINDPAHGRMSVPLSEFNIHFTGIAIFLSPNQYFKTRGKPYSLIQDLNKNTKSARDGMGFVFLASILFTFPGIILAGLSKIYIDEIFLEQRDLWLSPVLLGMLAALIFQICIRWLQLKYMTRMQIKISMVNSVKVMWHLLRLPIHFFYQRYTGDLNDRIQANETVSEIISSQLGVSLAGLITILLFGVALYLTSPILSFFVFFFLFLNGFILNIIVRHLRDATLKFLYTKGRLMGISMNGIRSIEVIKATNRQEDFFIHWAGRHADSLNTQQKMMLLNQVLILAPKFLNDFLIVIVLCLGGWLIIQGQLTMGALIAFQALLINFQNPILILMGFGEQLQTIRGEFMRLNDIMNYNEDPMVTESNATIQTNKIKGKIDIQHLTTGFSRVDPPFLCDINIHIPEHSSLAIVGATGSGKSTMAKLLAGLSQPWQGDILYEGQPLINYSRAQIASSIVLVEQEVYLYEGSIRDNISLWNESIPDEAIYQALREVDMYNDVISRGGLNAKVAEEGRNLSGGQRQRIEIARALVRNPEIIILDEATSMLDAVSEKIIYQNLFAKNKTIIIIAHRLSSIRHSDQIIVLDQGKISTQGTHDELVDTSEYYCRLMEGE